MQTDNNIKFAGDVSIEKVRIYSAATGLSQDIAAQVITIQMYEDIFSPFMTGSLIVKDSLDLINLFPFVGEEFLELQITTPSLEREKSNIKNTFYIYKLTDRELAGDRTMVYQLHFISVEAIVDLNKKVSRAFTGNIGDLIKTMVTDSVDGLESRKEVFVEPTSNNTKYVSNFWSPLENINFLKEQAVNSNNTPSYVFFENRDGFYFTSLETLYKGAIYQEFLYDNYSRDFLPNGDSIRNIEQDFKRITNISIPKGFDYMDRIRAGMLASKAISYDITKKTYKVKNYNLAETFSKKAHLNPHPLNSDNSIFRNNSVIIKYPRAYANFTGYPDLTNFKHVQERMSLMALAESNALNITVPGRSDYTAGQKVVVFLNKFEPVSAEDTDTTDKMFSGYYIIAAVNHYVDRESHECHMELIKDSSQTNPNEAK
jgi:hypothetical protein